MTIKDLLRNHDKDDHIYVIYIYQRTFKTVFMKVNSLDYLSVLVKEK